MVRQRHRARSGQPGAAADQRRHRRRVVRRLERRTAYQRTRGRQRAGDGVHGRHFEGGVGGKRRQQGRQPLREHGLARPRRAEQRQVVPAGGGQLDGPPAALLPGDVGEVGRRGLGGRRHHRSGQQRLGPAGVRHEPAQRVGRVHRHVRYQARLGRVRQRYHHVAQSGPVRGEDGGQYPTDRPDRTVQSQLPEQDQAPQRIGRQLAGRAQQARRHREVEARPVLGQVRRQQVDGHPQAGPLLSGVDDRGPYPVARLDQRRVGQPGHHEPGQPAGQVGLHHDDLSGAADQRDRVHPRVAHAGKGSAPRR